jgi:hypothetical protein
MKSLLMTALLTVAAVAGPAQAATNLINNGSFEQAGRTGTAGFLQWGKINIPSDAPASIIVYKSRAGYPNSAFGEAVRPADVDTASPDAVGNYAAYFVGDFSRDETITQLTYLTPGNYRVGFSYYLPANGLRNRGNSAFQATILDIPVASTNITNASPGQTWMYATGVGQITSAGWYKTSFVFNSNLRPSKDIVIDQVYALRTREVATTVIPASTILSVPEPANWAMLIAGFGMVGLARRRRTASLAA